jgi:secernin
VCDTVVALTDAGVLFAKNSDRDPNEAQLLEWHEAADHPAGARLACTWIDIPQAAHTYAVVISRPWWMWGAEMGANEHGVVIGNEAVFTNEPKGEPALLGMDLLRLALERAASASEAVSVIVELLEAHGQGGPCSHEHPRFTYHNSFLVADPAGAVVLETAGRHWATEEARGRGRSISNVLTIAGFAEAHADRRRERVSAGALRRAHTEKGARDARNPGDLMNVLRSHGELPYPRWSALNGTLAAPCVHGGGLLASSQTTASWVADLRGPARHWVTATGAPCTSLFKPVTVDRPVDLGPAATNRFDPASPWWRHELLHRATLRDFPALLPRYRAERDRVEREWLAAPPASGPAFEEAGRLEARWLADVAGSGVPDRRPAWLRRQWQRFDHDAGIDDPQLLAGRVAVAA